MGELLVRHEAAVRAGAFGLLLLVFAALERAAPRRPRVKPRGAHAAHNLALVLASTLAARVVLPLGLVGVAAVAESRGWGLLRLLRAAPLLSDALAVVALDLAVYAQHVASHRAPLLWRVHRVHHADLDLDATSGARFHPLEVVGSLGWKAAVVVALGASPAAVITFELLLNGMATFNHANVALPRALERVLRRVVVTPDVHRVHHSVHRDEQAANFGFDLVVWDRLFRTYRAAPRDGHEAMALGLADERDPERVSCVGWMLAAPFRQVGGGDAR